MGLVTDTDVSISCTDEMAIQGHFGQLIDDAGLPIPIQGVPVASLVDGDGGILPGVDANSFYFLTGSDATETDFQVHAEDVNGNEVILNIHLTATLPAATRFAATFDAPVLKASLANPTPTP